MRITTSSFVSRQSSFPPPLHHQINGTCLAHQSASHAGKRAIRNALPSVTIVTRMLLGVGLGRRTRRCEALNILPSFSPRLWGRDKSRACALETLTEQFRVPRVDTNIIPRQYGEFKCIYNHRVGGRFFQEHLCTFSVRKETWAIPQPMKKQTCI